MENLIFKDWKPRASAKGNILTHRPEPLRPATAEDKENLKTLLIIKETGKNPKTGRANKWDSSKEKEKDYLYHVVNQIPLPDELPTGAISWLEKEFRRIYWGRERILHNKFLEKGTANESDCLDLLEEVDGKSYFKNEEKLENEYTHGTPDNRDDDKIIDTKANYDMDSFDNADLNGIYEWQIKAYLFLDNKTEGELCYCLVNTPLHHLEAQRKSLFYSMGIPDEENEEWIEIQKQIERNMIFDPMRFKEEYPHYTFLNDESDLYVPAPLRVKRFEVKLEPDDIEFMKSRVLLARKWLCDKEIETLNRIKEFTRV